MKKLTSKLLRVLPVLLLSAMLLPKFVAADERPEVEEGSTVTLRISNWEEYIDEGEWAEDEAIDLEDQTIIGENSLLDDFATWYEETYGVTVNIEYSTFGTNEDLYNMLSLGDTFDLICPSEYMFMKLMSENQLAPLSEAFLNPTGEHNYYAKGVSHYIKNIFDSSEINGENWSKYAAGYMWGVTGFIYNPDFIAEEEADTWNLLVNEDYKRKITIKDNVRDSYFAAIGGINSEMLTSEAFKAEDDYLEQLEEIMNNTSPDEIQKVQDYLQTAKDNVYAFETDSGKSDMVTGKVYANYQWSGDAVYTMDQAEEDDVYLQFTVPEEVTNLYFDAWVMLDRGINGDQAKQHAAEAFINFISRPDNVVRNMYYIGYTSAISGGEDNTILDYLKWNYESEEESAVPYDTSYFFNAHPEEQDDSYVLYVDEEQLNRQLFAQYPDADVMARASIMRYFPPTENALINKMWVNVRCYNIYDLPVWGWGLLGLSVLGLIYLAVRKIQKDRKKK